MSEVLSVFTHLDPVLVIALAVAAGMVGAYFFKKFHFPQIVGYVCIGVLLGPVLRFIPPESVDSYEDVNMFALGLIGFLIGGELKRDIFVKFGRQVTSILLFEGLAAYLVVGLSTFVVLLFARDWQIALAVAVVFGAICSATDPASTVSVLWEYKARGPLTTILTAIVALDDALALGLYAISVSVAGVVTGHQEVGLFTAIATSLMHIAASLGVGAGTGFVLGWVLRRLDDDDKALIVTLSGILFCIGFSLTVHLDVIISTMSAGVVLINLKSKKAHGCFDLVHRYAAPVYVLFFVLVGARLRLEHLTPLTMVLAVTYVLGSIIGKTAGAFLGGLYSKSSKTVTRYLGFCLYPQGGIAVGLLIMASQRFNTEIAELMLIVVITGSLVLQLIGPIGVKIGAKRAGELGLNITEEDLIKKYFIRDVMDSEAAVISAGMSLREIIDVVSQTEDLHYAVVDHENNLLGAITLDGIRATFSGQELNDWLVALDLMEPVAVTVVEGESLVDAIDMMRHVESDYAIVTADGEGKKYMAMVTTRSVQRQLSAEVLDKQREADAMMYSHGDI